MTFLVNIYAFTGFDKWARIEHMSDQIIQASEISDYVYCRRSWWLKRAQGHQPQNVPELEAGTRYHQVHGYMVQRAQRARLLAYALLGIALATALAWWVGVF